MEYDRYIRVTALPEHLSQEGTVSLHLQSFSNLSGLSTWRQIEHPPHIIVYFPDPLLVIEQIRVSVRLAAVLNRTRAIT